MKRALFFAVGLLVLPPVAEAQIELGFDSGVRVVRAGGLSQTRVDIPAGWLRVGFPGETFTFESLIDFTVAFSSGQTASVIRILPGIVYHYRASTYFRGEVGLLLINEAGDSLSQFAFGIAVGTKRQIGPGPLYLRLEAGIDQWRENNDFAESSEYRALVGISVVVG